MKEPDISLMVAFAENRLKQVGELAPMMEIVRGDGGIEIIGMEFPDEAAKDAIAEHIKAHCRKINATQYTFVAESWMVTRDKDEGITERPSECFDRQEVVIFERVTPENVQLQVHNMVRDEEGQFLRLELRTSTSTSRMKEYADEDAAVLSGRWVSLIPAKEAAV